MGVASPENLILGFIRVYLLTSWFNRSRSFALRANHRLLHLMPAQAFGCGSNVQRLGRVESRGGPQRSWGKGNPGKSQTSATSGTCRFVGCLMRFFSLTKRDLPLVNSHAKNFRIFWDRDCLQLPWRAQPASFSRSSGGARGGFYYITAWVSARRSHAPGRCTGY